MSVVIPKGALDTTANGSRGGPHFAEVRLVAAEMLVVAEARAQAFDEWRSFS